MKKITAKVITISSQMLVVSLFLLSLFIGEGSNDKVTVVYNNNFDKMADSTVFLFEKEDLMTSQLNEDVVVMLEDNTGKEEDSVVQKEIDTKETEEDTTENMAKDYAYLDSIVATYTGILTGYGPDCSGCGNYKTGKVSTASGYHVANIVDGTIEPAFTITYNDSEYGEVRIVAADDDIPFYSIVRITVPGWDSSIMAIVLDRGSTVGFDNCRSTSGCLTNFDLLYPTEAESLGKTKNVTFELLRSGK